MSTHVHGTSRRPRPDLVTQLGDLAALHDAGKLTDAELDVMKAKLLDA